MYVLMFTCMCVAAEYRKEGLQKDKQRLQQSCTLTMHYLKKKQKNTQFVEVLPTGFFSGVIFKNKRKKKTATRLPY